MTQPAAKRATYADVLAAPRHLVAEIVAGELRLHPRPAPRHSLSASQLGGDLTGPFQRGRGGPGGWWILDEPELHLPTGDILVPDLAGWRLERMPELPETPYFEVIPDWIGEVLSPSTEAEDRADKLPLYLAAGVAHAWLVAPLVQTLECYRAESRRWVLLGAFKGSARVRAEPFEAIELDLDALWSPPVVRVPSESSTPIPAGSPARSASLPPVGP